MTSEAEKRLITYMMLGAEFDRLFGKPDDRTCANCRFHIEHGVTDRCARSGKIVVLDGSCKQWEVVSDD